MHGAQWLAVTSSLPASAISTRVVVARMNGGHACAGAGGGGATPSPQGSLISAAAAAAAGTQAPSSLKRVLPVSTSAISCKRQARTAGTPPPSPVAAAAAGLTHAAQPATAPAAGECAPAASQNAALAAREVHDALSNLFASPAVRRACDACMDNTLAVRYASAGHERVLQWQDSAEERPHPPRPRGERACIGTGGGTRGSPPRVSLRLLRAAEQARDCSITARSVSVSLEVAGDLPSLDEKLTGLSLQEHGEE